MGDSVQRKLVHSAINFSVWLCENTLLHFLQIKNTEEPFAMMCRVFMIQLKTISFNWTLCIIVEWYLGNPLAQNNGKLLKSSAMVELLTMV